MYKIIENIQPLLQDDYGQVNDCTLTSITTVIKFFSSNIPTEYIYNIIENIALSYWYSGEKGTNPLFINNIYNKTLKLFEINKSSSSRLIKNIGYNFNFIKKQINLGNPILLNLMNDGNNYYKNHTILIIGYDDADSKKLLLIFDNWEKKVNIIDYNKISIISSINYLK